MQDKITKPKRVQKQVAVELRSLGWQYAQIARYCDCSIAWCAQNLKQVQPNYELMKQVYEQAHNQTNSKSI